MNTKNKLQIHKFVTSACQPAPDPPPLLEVWLLIATSSLLSAIVTYIAMR